MIEKVGNDEPRRSEIGGLRKISNAERGLQGSPASGAFEEADKDGNRCLNLDEFTDCQGKLGNHMSDAEAELAFNDWSEELDDATKEMVITMPQYQDWWLRNAHLAASKSLQKVSALNLPNRAENCGANFAMAWCTLKLSGLSLAAKDREKFGL